MRHQRTFSLLCFAKIINSANKVKRRPHTPPPTKGVAVVAKFPRIIQLAIARIDNLISSAFFRRGRSKGYKAMKSDRAENMKALFIVQLQACCLEFQGGLCRVSGNLARPLTVPEMASLSKKNQRTIERCLADAKDLGLIHSEKQFIRKFPNGLHVAAVWRVFTQLFWEKLGLWGLFVESVKYAAQHARLKLKHPLKNVGKKKSPGNSEEQRRRSKQNNLWFAAMVACEHRPRAQSCPGGYQCAEICALCHQFPN